MQAKIVKIYRRLYGGGQVCAPHPYKCLQNFMTLRSYIFVSYKQITFYLGNFINLEALFLVVSMDSLQLVHVKSWKKKPEKVYIWSHFVQFWLHEKEKWAVLLM